MYVDRYASDRGGGGEGLGARDLEGGGTHTYCGDS